MLQDKPVVLVWDLVVVQQLVDEGINLHVVDEDGQTALHWAARGGHLEVVKALLEKGANPNFAAKNRQTALHLAARGGHLEVVKALLEKGANPKVDIGYHSYGEEALRKAIKSGHLERDGQTALSLAARGGHLEMVRALLEKGANLNSTDIYGQTALLEAARGGHLEVTKALLEKGANPNLIAFTKEAQTAVSEAMRGGHLEVVKTLLEKGANPHFTDMYGQITLCNAARGGHLELVKILLEKGANPNIADKDGQTVLYLAARGGHLEVVKALLNRGAIARVTTRNKYACMRGVRNVASQDETALCEAASGGYLELVKALLEKSVNPNIADKDGETPLGLAARGGYLEVVKALLAKDANPNAVGHKTDENPCSSYHEDPYYDPYKQSALHWAATSGHLEVVKILLEKGANPDITYDDKTPLWSAVHAGYAVHLDVAMALLEHGANLMKEEDAQWLNTKRKLLVFNSAQNTTQITIQDLDVKQITQFLDLVVQGWQEQAEVMLQKNRTLLLARGTVNDLAGRCSFQLAANKLDPIIAKLGNNGVREFQNITAFQYALWALDMHMAVMLRKYLDQYCPGEAALQAHQSQATWMVSQGMHAGPYLQLVIDALDVYQDLLPNSCYETATSRAHWIKEVGGAQLLLPMHVLNEYCHPSRIRNGSSDHFEPTREFSLNSVCLRSRKSKIWDGSKYIKVDDIIALPPLTESKYLGVSFGLYRQYWIDDTGWCVAGQGDSVDLRELETDPSHFRFSHHKDCDFLKSLLQIRVQQREELLSNLAPERTYLLCMYRSKKQGLLPHIPSEVNRKILQHLKLSK